MMRFYVFPNIKPVIMASAIATSMLFTGCAVVGSGSETSSANASAKRSFNEYVEAWKRRDPQAIVQSLHANGTYTAPDAGERLNPQQFTGYTQTLFGAVPDFTVQKAVGYMVDEDTMAEEWVVSGTWTKPFAAGPLAGIPPTGKSFTLPGSAFIDFKDGKITSVVQYFDNLSLLTQLGVVQTK